MINKKLSGHIPSFEDIHNHGLKMLIVIVNRSDCEKVVKFLRERHFHFQLVCLAQGTAGFEILDLLGFGTTDKAVVLCIAPDFRISDVFSKLADEFKLSRHGKGIAFTIPLLGMAIPAVPSARQEFAKQWQENIEKEVDKMNNDITHSVIITVLNEGYSEELIEKAKAAGAKGGTILNARSTGTEDVVKFFGVSVQAEREIVAILVNRENKSDIMEVLNASYGVSSQARGIVLSLPVDGVAGLS